MTPFVYLLVGHLVGDYLIQTSWMAENKARHWGALFLHCTLYTLAVAAAALWGGVDLPLWSFGLLFLSHVLLDRRTFVVWWNRVIMGNTTQNWLFIMTDQIFHILVLALLLHYFGVN